MSNYVQTTLFTPKDSLPSGNPNKLIVGAQFDTEFGNIATAIATKYDSTTIGSSPVAFANGSAALPGVTFTGGTNNNTGVYLSAANSLGFSANGVAAGSIASGGAWSLPAANNAVTFTVAGASGSYAAQFNGNSGTGVSRGLGVFAGTNNSDIAALFANQANTQDYLEILGNGEIYIDTPPAANAPPSGCFQVGYMEIPQRVLGGNSTLGITDRGKQIYWNSGGAVTVTIPANASVAFPVGTAVTLINQGGSAMSIQITSDTLSWSPSGSTGSRSLSPNGMATIIKTTSTNWMISGTGLS